MVHREDGPGEGDAGEGTARDEHGLKCKGADVADEGDVGVDLARVAGLTDGEPSDQEDGEGREPGEACAQWKEVQFVGVAEVAVEDAGPEAFFAGRWCHCSRWRNQREAIDASEQRGRRGQSMELPPYRRIDSKMQESKHRG